MNLQSNASIHIHDIAYPSQHPIFNHLTTMVLVQTTNSLRVAVARIRHCRITAARTLADRGVQVTVFEAGHGRKNTDPYHEDDSHYQFDHGAQYMSPSPKPLFQDALDQWKETDGSRLVRHFLYGGSWYDHPCRMVEKKEQWWDILPCTPLV
jgi:hypothetical protein